MGQVVVEIGGRGYTLSCRDGDESHLTELASGIAKKADDLTQSLGPMSEARLLLMAALMVADELHELRGGKLPANMHQRGDLDPETTDRLTALLARTERLAGNLDS
jgi:cell division protein ZapA